MPSSLAVLRDFMLQRYDDLKARLTRRLGCADMASDALQDTWLRLEGKDELGPVDSPGAYLLRMAVNVAVDQQRAENRRLTSSEAEALLALLDPAPGRRRRRKAARNWTRWCGSWASCPSVSAGAVGRAAGRTAAGRGGDAHGCVVAHRGARIAQRA